MFHTFAPDLKKSFNIEQPKPNQMNTSFLKKLGLLKKNDGTWTGLKSSNSGEYVESYSPVDGKLIGSVSVTTKKEYEKVIKTSQKAAVAWRQIPAPKRGDIVRQYGDALRNK